MEPILGCQLNYIIIAFNIQVEKNLLFFFVWHWALLSSLTVSFYPRLSSVSSWSSQGCANLRAALPWSVYSLWVKWWFSLPPASWSLLCCWNRCLRILFSQPWEQIWSIKQHRRAHNFLSLMTPVSDRRDEAYSEMSVTQGKKLQSESVKLTKDYFWRQFSFIYIICKEICNR